MVFGVVKLLPMSLNDSRGLLCGKLILSTSTGNGPIGASGGFLSERPVYP
jgi:hypothetical protein